MEPPQVEAAEAVVQRDREGRNAARPGEIVERRLDGLHHRVAADLEVVVEQEGHREAVGVEHQHDDGEQQGREQGAGKAGTGRAARPARRRPRRLRRSRVRGTLLLAALRFSHHRRL
jgi:hypothetical protein